MKEKITQHFQKTILSIISNEIHSIFTKNKTNTACRIYKDGKIGIAGCVGEADVDKLYSKAEHNLEYQINYPVEPTKNIESHIKIDSCKMTSNEFYSKFEYILKEIAHLHPDFALNNEIRLCQCEYSMENELGMNLSYFDRYIEILLLMKAKNTSDNLNIPFCIQTRDLEPDKIIKAISEDITAYSNLIPLPQEPLPLIFQDDTIKEIFYRELGAVVFGTGSSLFQNQIGKEVFSKNFSLKINNDPLENYSKHFDSEGVITPENLSYLIKDGVIIRPFSDKRTSKLYGYENTGCAGGAYNSVPSLGGPVLNIQPGSKSLKELLNGQKGIVLQSAIGGDFTPDGNFASPVFISFLTDGEKLLARLPMFIIKSSIYDFLGKNFIGMSNDKLYTIFDNRMVVTRMNIEQL